MRIVSLLPACTEWVVALGAADLLVGRSHECVKNPGVAARPVVTRASVPDGSAADIDAAVRSRLQQGLSLYHVDFDALGRLRPDLILTQTQCDVCAVSGAELDAELQDLMEPQPELFSFDPRTFKDVLNQALQLARRVGHLREAMQYIAEQEAKLKLLHESVGISRNAPAESLPTIACIEWLEPIMTSGNWVPDLVDLAGGRAVCTEHGAPSRVVPWEEVRDADPDVLAVMACGFDVERTRREMHFLETRPGWRELAAVRAGQVFVFDGRSYFNTPGPDLYRSVELLASVLHESAAGVTAAPAEVQRITIASDRA